MGTQSIRQNLVVLKSLTGKGNVVKQDDFEELILYANLRNEADRRYQEKYEEIKAAIESGAEIEPGIHMARLIDVCGGGTVIPRYRYKRLVFK